MVVAAVFDAADVAAVFDAAVVEVGGILVVADVTYKTCLLAKHP